MFRVCAFGCVRLLMGILVCTECEFQSEVLDRCTKTISRLLQGISRVSASSGVSLSPVVSRCGLKPLAQRGKQTGELLKALLLTPSFSL